MGDPLSAIDGHPQAGGVGGTRVDAAAGHAPATAGEGTVSLPLVHPSGTIKEGFLHTRTAGGGTLLPRFKKRYFWLSPEALSYSKSPEWQVGAGRHPPTLRWVPGRGGGCSDPRCFGVSRCAAPSPCRRCGRWSGWMRAPSSTPTSCRWWRRTAPGSSTPPTSSTRWVPPPPQEPPHPRTKSPLPGTQPWGPPGPPGDSANGPGPKSICTQALAVLGTLGRPVQAVLGVKGLSGPWPYWETCGILPWLYWDQYGFQPYLCWTHCGASSRILG